jgi:hypothetical protein
VVTAIDWVEPTPMFTRDGDILNNTIALQCGFRVLSTSGVSLAELTCSIYIPQISVSLDQRHNLTTSVEFTDELDWKEPDFTLTLNKADSGSIPTILYQDPTAHKLELPSGHGTGSDVRFHPLVTVQFKMCKPNKTFFRSGIPMEALTLYYIREQFLSELNQ